MKPLLTFLLVLLFISCESEPKQYQLSTTDVQKLEELTCYFSEKYQDEKANLSFTRDLQTRVTVAYDRFLLKEMVATSQQTLADLEHNFNTLQTCRCQMQRKSCGIK